jgi:uncharacterized protein YecT (DUF1311 family)
MLNRDAKAIFELLRDRTARARFVAAETAWRAYREKTCTSVADIYRGGTVEPLSFAACKAGHNRLHLREVAAFEHELRRLG